MYICAHMVTVHVFVSYSSVHAHAHAHAHAEFIHPAKEPPPDSAADEELCTLQQPANARMYARNSYHLTRHTRMFARKFKLPGAVGRREF